MRVAFGPEEKPTVVDLDQDVQLGQEITFEDMQVKIGDLRPAPWKITFNRRAGFVRYQGRAIPRFDTTIIQTTPY